MLKPDASHGLQKVPRTRLRISTSCTECKRRKQKCNQSRDKPCNNCARRYPPVVCEYERDSKPARFRERVIELEVVEPITKTEVTEEGSSEVIAKFNPYGVANVIQTHGTTQPYRASRACSVASAFDDTGLQDEPDDNTGPNPADQNPINVLVVGRFPSKELEVVNFARNGDGRGTSSPYPPYPEHQSDFENLIVHVSPALSPLRHLPIEYSRHNADFLEMFLQSLAPYMSSIDGQDPLTDFNDEYLRFSLQSPLNIYIPILTTAYFKAAAKGIDVEKSVDAVAARVKLITLINEQLRDPEKGITDEALVTVQSLAYNELIYADKKSVLAHMKGLRSMIRTRGGLETLQNKMLRMCLLKTDYQVAVNLECDPFIDTPNINDIPTFTSYPPSLDSPLLLSATRFTDPSSTLGLAPETATILDDMRFLTTSILHFSTSPSPSSMKKFHATTTWIHRRLSSPPPPSLSTDNIHHSIRTTALIFSHAILTRTPLSRACTPALLTQLWSTQWRVPLKEWKRIPGIFFWVVLTTCPFTCQRPEGRWLKGMQAACTIAIGMVDWGVCMGMLRGFLRVQRWLGEGGGGEEEGKG